MSEPKSDEEIVEEFRSRFSTGETQVITDYEPLFIPDDESERRENWLRSTLAAVRRKERIACIQQIEQMRDQPLTQRDARDICNLIVNALTPTQDDTNLST